MSRSTAEWMELMARSVDGDLCARERVELEAALEADPALKALQSRFSAVKKCCLGLSSESLDEGFDQRMKRRVRLLRQRQWMTRGVAAAAAVAAMAVGVNQLTQQGRVTHVGQGLMAAAAGVGGGKSAPPERTSPGAFGQGKQAETAQSPEVGNQGQTLALAPQAAPRDSQNTAAPALSDGFAKTLTRAAQVMKSVPQTAGESQRATAPVESDDAPADAPVEIAAAPAEEERPVNTEAVAAKRTDIVAAAPAPPPAPSVALRPRVVELPPVASSGVSVSAGRGRAAAAIQPVNFLQERFSSSRRVAISPVRLVSYLKNAGDGLIDRVLIKVDRNMPWMRVQGLVNLLFVGEPQAAATAAAPMAAGSLSAAPAEFRVTPQSLVRFLSLLPGPTPLQTVSATGESPKPVMVSEVLPQMAPVLTVAITPGTD